MEIISRKLLRIYKLPFSILLFALLFGIVHVTKPGLAYLPNGAYRPFGVGFKHKTVVPIWLISIILAILSYTFVLFILSQT
jgi:hypothetical protein